MAHNIYCGIGKIPKGKIRGTPEACIRANQVRYYGLVTIDESLLETAKGSTTNLIKEQLKLKSFEDMAKILVNDIKKVKITLDDKRSTRSEIKKAQKKMDGFMVKRDLLVKKLKDQKAVVLAAEAEQRESRKRAEQQAKKESKEAKSKTKSKTKSGSKSTKKKSKKKSKTK